MAVFESATRNVLLCRPLWPKLKVSKLGSCDDEPTEHLYKCVALVPEMCVYFPPAGVEFVTVGGIAHRDQLEITREICLLISFHIFFFFYLNDPTVMRGDHKERRGGPVAKNRLSFRHSQGQWDRRWLQFGSNRSFVGQSLGTHLLMIEARTASL